MIKESKRHKYAAIEDDRVDLIENAVVLVNIFQRAKEGDPDLSFKGGRELEANEAATYDAALGLLERSFKAGPRSLRDTYMEESDETLEDEGEPVKDEQSSGEASISLNVSLSESDYWKLAKRADERSSSLADAAAKIIRTGLAVNAMEIVDDVSGKEVRGILEPYPQAKVTIGDKVATKTQVFEVRHRQMGTGWSGWERCGGMYQRDAARVYSQRYWHNSKDKPSRLTIEVRNPGSNWCCRYEPQFDEVGRCSEMRYLQTAAVE